MEEIVYEKTSKKETSNCIMLGLLLMVASVFGILLSQTQVVYASTANDYPDLKFTLYNNNGKSEYRVTALKRRH